MNLVDFWECEVLPRLNVEGVYTDVRWAQRGPRFWRGACPLHGGKDANFSVDAHTLRWRCFSHCGGGSLFAFLNDGNEPRGAEWVKTLRTLADFAGVTLPNHEFPPEVQKRIEERQRRDHLLESVASFAADFLLRDEGMRAREYLTERGFETEALHDLPLGFFPTRDALDVRLKSLGFHDDEITASGILRDGRFEGRLLIVWRDARGRIGTFATRALDRDTPAAEKYLYLSREHGWGRPKADVVAFGLDTALPALRQTSVAFAASPSRFDSTALILVEGLLDALTLHARGVERVVAVGGSGREMTNSRLSALFQLGVRHLTVCLDNDPKPNGSWPGQEGSLHIARLAASPKVSTASTSSLNNGDNAENSQNSANSINGNVYNVCPIVSIVPPHLLGGHKDADAYVRARGVEEFLELLEHRQSAATFLGSHLLDKVAPQSSEATRRVAVERILEFEAELSGPRAALDREELRRLTTERTGFSTAALEEVAALVRLQTEARQRQKALQEWLRSASRRLDEVAREEANFAPSNGSSPSALEATLADLNARLASLRTRECNAPAPFSVARLDEEGRQQPPGRTTGWKALDDLGARFTPGEFALVGARTGHGKTSFLVALALQWLDSENPETAPDEKLLFYSLEEPELRVYHRLLALIAARAMAVEAGEERGWMNSGPSQNRSTEGVWSVAQVRDWCRDPNSRGNSYGWPDPRRLDAARERLRALENRVQIVFRPDWSLDDIEAHARSVATAGPLSALMVDYLQRVPPPQSGPNGRFDRRDQEVSAIGRRFKALACDLSVPIIAGAQINREAIPEGYSKQMNNAGSYEAARINTRSARPELHHLREGGSEQEADLALGLLNYAADYRGETPTPSVTRLEVGTLKNRSGEVGKWATLAFEGRSGLVRDGRPGEDV